MKNERSELEAAAFRTRQAIHALIMKGRPIGAELQRLIDEWHLAAGYARALMLDDEPTYLDHAHYLRGYLAAKEDLLYIGSIPAVREPQHVEAAWQLSGGMYA